MRTRREYPDGYVVQIGERLRLVEFDEQGRRKLYRTWHPRDGGTPPWTPRRYQRRSTPPYGWFFNGARVLRSLVLHHLWVFRRPVDLAVRRFFCRHNPAYVPILATLEQTPHGRDRQHWLVGNGSSPGFFTARRLPFT